ncbi:MAG: class I SAM-dependent methyltransferase [Bdellovibrionota bacterium]|nr:class I SAM-dependent methyltransferase [Bdellovibrionota bacterium]
MAVRVHGGKHPKKAFLKYEDWFLENIHDNSVIVDIGSNNGFLANHLATKASHVYGIELSKTYVDIANHNKAYDNITYYLADATTFDYSQLGQVDYITLSNVLEHIQDRVNFIKKIIVLKNPNTKLLIRVPTLERDWISPYLKSLKMPYFLDPTHYIEHTEDEIKAEVAASGLRIESLSTKYGEYYLVCSIK